MGESAVRLLSVVFECGDAQNEATFWESLLGWRRRDGDDPDDPDWVTIVDPGNAGPGGRLSFQRVDDHVPPTWPARERPQQAHVDLLVDDLAVADARARTLGARRLTDTPVVHEEESFNVYADPAGHPFCLIVQAEPPY